MALSVHQTLNADTVPIAFIQLLQTKDIAIVCMTGIGIQHLNTAVSKYL